MAITYPQPRSLEEIITSKKYKVPVYQRSYAWDKDKVSELWNDVKRNEPPYYLGTLLLKVTEEKNTFEVVDGQQRLATLLLLLLVATEVLEAQDKKSAKEIYNGYINQKKPLAKGHELPLILSRRDREKFERLLLRDPFKSKKKYLSWRYLDGAMNFFREEMDVLMKEKGIEGVKSFVRDQVLELVFLDVEVEDDNDVYLFFETLNDRGTALTIADLVKNRVCAMAAENNLSPDDMAGKVDEISEKIGSKMAAFLLHYCWSKADSEDGKPIPRKRLMNWYNTIIGKEKEKFLENLEGGAFIYSDFIEPRKITRDSKKKEILTYLKLLNATRCYPLLLQGELSLPHKEFLRLCKAIEVLTFRHSTILNKDAKVLESVYYDLTKQLKRGTKTNVVLNTLKAQAKEISDSIFKAAFTEFSTNNNQLARYILLKLEEQKTPRSAPLDWENLTLEHILSRGSSWKEKELYLNRLGNHTLLSAPLNKDVANKEFKKKKEEYKKEKRIQLTKDLLGYTKFTKKEIEKRQAEFADLAIEIWDPKNIA